MNTTRLRTETPAAIDTHLVAVLTEADALRARLAVLAFEEENIATEYASRRWTRAYLVTGGHLHSSTACSSCYPTTRFFFLPEFSGATEAEIVEAAGERACTVCFPDAPVDVLKKASRLFTPDEEAAAKAREEREAKRAAAAAAAITVTGLDEYRGRAHTFKTERALRNFISSTANSIEGWMRYDAKGAFVSEHPSSPKWRGDLLIASEALAKATGEDARTIRDAALAKAKTKAEKERRALGLY